MSEDIYLESRGAVAELVLNRPAKRNAITSAMWLDIPRLLQSAADNPEVKLLIVRGAGGSFAAGADIAEFEVVYATRERAEAYTRSIGMALDSLAAFPKPTLARIEGACVGGGCGVALSCDLRFAATGSRFAITPAKLGLTYTLNDTKRLIDAVGVSFAKDILYSGRMLDAEEAFRIGLINRLVDPETLSQAVEEYAQGLSATSAYSARTSKKIISMIRAGVDADTDETRQMFLDAFQGEDFQEGYRAFLEKRSPRFPGQS